MVVALFFVNVVGAFIVLLSTSMLNNHFKKIEDGMAIYTSDKAYKPESRISFIVKVLDKYNALKKIEVETSGVEAMISNLLQEERIGQFKFVKVFSVATKGKLLLWSVLIGQIAIEILLNNVGISITGFSFIIANTVLCILITFAQIIKAVSDKKEHLIIKIYDYITNTYPIESVFKEKDNKIQELMEKLQQLENEKESEGLLDEELLDKELLDEGLSEKSAPYNMQKYEELNEEDIIQLITSFVGK